MRPLCESCGQRPKAVNCHRGDRIYYRRRCESCNKKNKKLRPTEPRWKLAGYKKKPHCDRCGFKAKHTSQLLVYHVDGNLNNSELRNLKTICMNCTAEIKRLDFPWKPGDLEPDF